MAEPTPSPAGAGRDPGGQIPALDGIRALAVALVFAAHSGLERVVPGGLGVTVFFVLSGFLITTLMRIEHDRFGRIGLRAFWLRRLLRLMPPLVIVLAAAGLLSAFGVIGGGFTTGGFFAALLYGGNYHAIANDFRGMPAGIGLVWSLAIEEHFYLLYPLLAIGLLRLRRRRMAAALLLALCLATLAWRVWLLGQGASVAWLTMATDTRADAILFGCVLALWRNPWLDAPRPARAVGDATVALGCATALLLSLVVRDESFRLTLRYTIQAVAVAGLLSLAVTHATRWPARWLGARPLVYLGTVSYTVYLVHHVVLLGLARHAPDWGWLPLTLVGALLTLAVAEPMRRWVERPIADWRRRLHRHTPPRTPAGVLSPLGTP